VAYRADIEIAVRGAQELKRLQNEIRLSADAVNSLNSSFAGVANLIPRSINNLNKVVAEAAANFNKVALGTEEASTAARAYVNATNELNKGLRERLQLVRNIQATESAAQRRITPTSNAGYGQQMPALPPAMVRAKGIQQSWSTFFREAAELGTDLKTTAAAKAINLKQSWNTFFTEAAELAVDIKAAVQRASAEIRASEGAASTAARARLAAAAVERRANISDVVMRPISGAAYPSPAGPGGSPFAEERARASQASRALEQQVTATRTAEMQASRVQAQADLKAVRDRAMAENYITNLLTRRLAAKAKEVQLEKQQTAEVKNRAAAESRGRTGGAVSSALIGGGFPLLFGQGPAAAAGGAVGGLAGGLVGGGFGFALSIVGTALGDAAEKADTFNKQLAGLNSQVSGTGNAAKVTSKDVSNLAKTFGIANDEALKLLQSFAGFGDASVTKSLAFLYGDDASILKGLAAAKDQADLAQVILGAYEKIGIERATQLINQIKLGDSAAVELAFQKALLDARIKQTEEGLKQITIQDRIVAGLATAASFMGGGQGQIIDPAVFGQQRVIENRKNNPPSSIFTNALQGLRQLRSATQGVESLRPDKGADKAAKDAERERQRVAQVVRDRNAEASILRIQSGLQQKIADAELKRDPILVARLQGEERILAIQYQYAKELANEKNLEAQIAITREGRAAVKKQQVENEIRLNAIYAERKEFTEDTIKSLQYELNLKNATTEAERNNLRIAYEMEALKKGGQVDANALPQIEALKKQLAAPETAGEIIQKRIGALQDELTKLTNIGNIAVSVADSIGTAFSQAFQGIISGTMTAQEALASFFQSVGDAFIQMASEIIAKQITMIILQTILKALGGGGGGASPFAGGPATGGETNTFAYAAGAPQFRADGGSVRASTPYLVGERGPELFVPGTSGGVMSNSDLRSSMGAAPGSSGGPVLNMSFETSTINGVEYVSRDQLEAAMAETRRQATRDGAKRGMSMTLDRIQQSPQTRSRIGIR
jgi:hypothetical protein